MEKIQFIRENIDYKETKLDKRKEIVEEILNEVDNDLFDYFSNSFKTNLTSKDKLSHEDNVCRTLENLANYLLNAEEIKQEKNDEEFKYVFHTDEQYFQKKMQRENSLESMSSDSNEDNIIHFLVRSKRNYKKAKTQFVIKSDLKRPGLVGEVLRAYNDELERISDKLKRENLGNIGNRYLLTRASGQIKTDMIIVKDQLLGTFGYNSNPSENTEYDFDFLDYGNPLHIEALMRTFADFEPQSELAYVVMAFEELAGKTLLTPRERNVLSFVRMGLKNHEIAQDIIELGQAQLQGLNVTQQWVGAMVNNIAKKIAKEGAKYEF